MPGTRNPYPADFRDQIIALARAGRSVVFEFMIAPQAVFPVQMTAKVMGVSRSGFFGWTARRPSARATFDRNLSEQIGKIRSASKAT